MSEVLEIKVCAFLKQNDQSICDVKCVLSQKNFELMTKMFNHTLSDKAKSKLEGMKMFTYKHDFKDPISGETAVVEKSITIGTAIQLMERQAFTESDIQDFMKGETDAKHSVRSKLSVAGSKQAQQLRAIKTGSTIKATDISLAVPVSDSKYTAPDKYFYSWWVKDEMENIYMKTKDKKLIMVPLKEGGEGRIQNSNEFWNAFWKAHRDDFVKWENDIRRICWDIYEAIGNDDEYFDTKNPAVECHKLVPKFFLQNLSLSLTQIEVEETKTILGEDGQPKTITSTYWKTSDISPKIRTGRGDNSQTAVINEDSMQEVFKSSMANFDKSEIKYMKRFSNVYDPEHPAFFVIQRDLWESVDSSCLDDKGNPAMPEIWKTFLSNKFKIDPGEQLYRLASFVMSIVEDDNYSRQILVLCGEGNDGKSTFINVLTQFFNSYTGKKFAASCPAEGLKASNTQNGLVNCLDARLITIGDIGKVSEVLEYDIMKQLTGSDPIVCNKKYCDPISKDMKGVKFIFSTNNKVFMENTAAVTRVIPMYFTPRSADEPDMDMMKLKDDLVATMPQFLKWCYYFKTKIREQYNIVDKSTKIFSFDNKKTTKECYETLYSKEQKFFYQAKDEYALEDENYFEQFISEYIKFDNDVTSNKEELFIHWNQYARDKQIEDVYKVRPKSADLRNLYKYIAKAAVENNVEFNNNYPKNENGRSYRVLKGVKFVTPSKGEVVELDF